MALENLTACMVIVIACSPGIRDKPSIYRDCGLFAAGIAATLRVVERERERDPPTSDSGSD